MTPSVLIIEDDIFTSEFIKTGLEKKGFRVFVSEDAISAYDIYATEKPDVLLMDLSLPGKDGYILTRQIREEDPMVGIIHLSSRRETMDRILGLEIGADAYIGKPFDMNEVVAQIIAIHRRIQHARSLTNEPEQPSENMIHYRDVRLDIDKQIVYNQSGAASPLSHTEFQILKTLISHPGKVFSRQELLTAARSNLSSDTRAVDLVVAKLRYKLQDPAKGSQYIITIQRVGYMFKA